MESNQLIQSAHLALTAYAKSSGDLKEGSVDVEPEAVITTLIGNLLEIATAMQVTTDGKLDRARAISTDALHAFEDALSCRTSLIDQLEELFS